MQKASYSSKGQGGALEICVESVRSALAAEQGGAQRVELCDSLVEGGTTPSAGLIEVTRKNISIGLHVLIRPRRGDFLYSDLEFEILKHDIAMAKRLGADGVVLGMLKEDGEVDTERMQELMVLARPLSVTFHRAFDLTPDPFKALNDLICLKVDRLLTSGQEQTALQGTALIRALVEKAGDKLVIMPGSGINAGNVYEIISKTGVKEVHASARKKVDGTMRFRKNYPPMSSVGQLSEFEFLVTDEEQVKAMREALEKSNAPIADKPARS
ncbi:copper homeostasis protein [Pontibacter ummariensis]|uniref:PF03932 family protein CutC n=1 Tax=Pontibacter ummariensis TaxID=1610492 RepID=A0A239G1U1_9BACT|nr:copper homeostasis protein CutC [Pontibacter ummariensis]PRY11677.1 copper homeostasis protein [Pontibacter ummariensis]SNS63121.1 copper homeostasis protein [Pontibacter ummariensis]